jgi:hypothetical protein
VVDSSSEEDPVKVLAEEVLVVVLAEEVLVVFLTKEVLVVLPRLDVHICRRWVILGGFSASGFTSRERS